MKKGLTAALVVVACLAYAPPASAVTFGADLTQTPDSDLGAPMVGDPITAVTLIDSAGMPETGSPISGVLVSARVKTTGDAASTLVVRVLRETGVSTYFNVAPEVPLPVPALMTPQITESTGLHHPILLGDRLGVGYTKTMNFGITRGDTGMASTPVVHMVHPAGTSLAYGAGEGKELLLEGTVEPDADGDTFGDESQDQCPASAGPQAGCPLPVAVPSTKPTAKKKKCKKKKRKKRAAAAKRCKKKKKK